MDISNIIKYKDLFYMISWREIKVKYKQSFMGILWALFMPIIIISAGILVKYSMSKVAGTQFSYKEIASVSIKAIPWSFFVSSIRFSTNSLTSNFSLVTKIKFPKIIFPLSSVFSQLIDFVIAASFMVIFLLILGYGFSAKSLFAIVLLAILIVYTIALSILLSAANLFFRDVKYIVEVVLTFAIFFTPVFYEVKLFGAWDKLLLLNPISPILECLNGCLVMDQFLYMEWVAYSAVFSFLLLLSSIKIFNKVEPMFAEYI